MELGFCSVSWLVVLLLSTRAEGFECLQRAEYMTNKDLFKNSQMEMEVTKCFLEANNPVYFEC